MWYNKIVINKYWFMKLLNLIENLENRQEEVTNEIKKTLNNFENKEKSFHVVNLEREFEKVYIYKK